MFLIDLETHVIFLWEQQNVSAVELCQGYIMFKAMGFTTFQMRISREKPWQRGPRYGCCYCLSAVKRK